MGSKVAIYLNARNDLLNFHTCAGHHDDHHPDHHDGHHDGDDHDLRLTWSLPRGERRHGEEQPSPSSQQP